ncbi:MAG: OmpH family outer membrane protein [Bacteroidales bacterium]|jgi:outer membrane protein|nr:OmpH family outer membrane protein [Bacteroidales bacterium]
MKNLLKLLVITLFLFSGTAVNAQNFKFGHVNSQELLSLMPERDSAQAKIQQYAKDLEGELEIMNVEYNNKLNDYIEKQDVLTPLVKKTKEQELNEFQNRIQDFSANAQQELQQQEAQLIQPIIQKAEKAINDVGKENGYIYIFDLSRGTIIYFSEQSEDVLPLVLKKLGLEE